MAWVCCDVEGARNLMFGVECPVLAMKPYLVAYKKAIPQEHWNAVFHDKAGRVVKCPGWKDLK
jgi:hypothetical protein